MYRFSTSIFTKLQLLYMFAVWESDLALYSVSMPILNWFKELDDLRSRGRLFHRNAPLYLKLHFR